MSMPAVVLAIIAPAAALVIVMPLLYYALVIMSLS